MKLVSAMTFDGVKREVRAEQSGGSKYSQFLDKLAIDYDNRGITSEWDIWYFSLNTEFCLESARFYLTELAELTAAHARINELIANKQPHDADPRRRKFTFDDMRRSFGSFLFYLYAALESFSHEANILYGMGLPKSAVSLRRVEKWLQQKPCRLERHVQDFLLKSNVKTLLEYRNATMHGYVYPWHGRTDGLFLSVDPKANIFSFSGVDMNASRFTAEAHAEVSEFVCGGWRCFSEDELS